MVFPHSEENIQAVTKACTVLLREELMNFSWWFVAHRKKLEKVDFVDEEFLDKKVNKNGVYMRIMVCYRRYSRRYM